MRRRENPVWRDEGAAADGRILKIDEEGELARVGEVAAADDAVDVDGVQLAAPASAAAALAAAAAAALAAAVAAVAVPYACRAVFSLSPSNV